MGELTLLLVFTSDVAGEEEEKKNRKNGDEKETTADYHDHEDLLGFPQAGGGGVLLEFAVVVGVRVVG